MTRELPCPLSPLSIKLGACAAQDPWRPRALWAAREGEDEQWSILEASFYRHDERIPQSEALLVTIEAAAKASQRNLPAQWYLQKGLNAFVRHQHGKSLWFFKDAEKRAGNDLERLVAWINQLFILEYEGHVDEDLLARVEAMVFASSDPLVAEHQLAWQLRAMAARMAYRSGNFAKIAAMIASGIQGDQVSYYLSWIASHPLLALPHSDSYLKATSRYLMERHGSVYLGRYHRATLLYQTELQSDEPVKVTEVIERLYLWTWKWMTSADAHLLPAICDLVEELRQAPPALVSHDDYELAVISVQWLLLFSGQPLEAAKDLLKKLGVSHEMTLPILRAEQAVIEHLAAFRGQGCDVFMQNVTPGGLFVAWDLKDINVFAQAVRSLLEGASTIENGLIVSKDGSSLRNFQVGGECAQSDYEPAARLALLATQATRCSVQQIMQYCYGYKTYDALRHDGKLAKLLVKTNKVAEPWLSAKRRGESVLFVKRSLVVEERAAVARQLAHSSFLSLLHGPVARTVEAPVEEGLLSRADIEALCGCSKATATRHLTRWVQQGQAKKISSGKATFYVLEKDLLETLSVN